MLTLFTLLLLQAAASPFKPATRVDAPPTWVAFSADLKITNPKRADAFGRYLQDEHGCIRRETVHPDRSLMVTINNFQIGKTYTLMRGAWTSQDMRLVPGMPRRPRQTQVDREAGSIEGFKAYVSVVRVRSPRGDYSREATVIPALNFFEAVQTVPNGDTIIAQNIRLGAPDHAEFLPPPGAAIGEPPGFGGFMQFSAVALRVTFPDQRSSELTTTEEQPIDVRTPSGDTIQLVTTVVDDAQNLVRVRVMKNAARKRPGTVEGDVLEDVHLTLGGSVLTTKLAENFELRVTRIRDRRQ